MNDYIDSYLATTRTPGEARAPLEGQQDAEVCVVGGGLAGLSTAIELAERGVRVTLLEGRRIGWGASGRNLGMVGPGFSLGIRKIIARVGMADARELFALSLEGASTVRRRATQHDMQCEPMAEGIINTTLFDDSDALRRSSAFMIENFGLSYDFWSRERLREAVVTDRYRAGLMVKGRFMLHPLNYCRGLADAAEAMGTVIHEGSSVISVNRVGAQHVVCTQSGEVRADTLVIACGGQIEGLLLKLARAIVPVASYVIATEPLGDEKLRSAFKLMHGISDNRLAGDYYRPLPDTRILWGGRMSVRRSRPPNLADVLLGDLLRIYPQLEGTRVESSWHGLMGYAAHHMPLVGELTSGIWYAMGFAGLGLNTTAMAGKMIAAAITEDDDRYRLLEPFGLVPTGGPIGAAAAQLTYWYHQLKDGWRALGVRS